jgi:hypothetical protein
MVGTTEVLMELVAGSRKKANTATADSRMDTVAPTLARIVLRGLEILMPKKSQNMAELTTVPNLSRL